MKSIEEKAKAYSKEVNGEYYDELHPNCDRTIGEVSENDYAAGFKDAQKWISVEDELPICFESGTWDGLRSEYVLVLDGNGNWDKGILYSGKIDGHKYNNWYDSEDFELSDIISWRPIEFK